MLMLGISLCGNWIAIVVIVYMKKSLKAKEEELKKARFVNTTNRGNILYLLQDRWTEQDYVKSRYKEESDIDMIRMVTAYQKGLDYAINLLGGNINEKR